MINLYGFEGFEGVPSPKNILPPVYVFPGVKIL
jgi:hypothetical protein